MTGRECFDNEMRERGITSQSQINSKAVAVAIDILSQSNGEFIKIKEAEEYLEKIQEKIKSYQDHIEHIKRVDERERKALEFARESRDTIFNQETKTALEYIDSFFETLKKCETPEGRDAIKRAQTFINSVKIDTKYDNTAFIIGLSAILTDGKIDPIEQLKAINPTIGKNIPRHSPRIDGGCQITTKHGWFTALASTDINDIRL